MIQFTRQIKGRSPVGKGKGLGKKRRRREEERKGREWKKGKGRE